MKKKTLCPVTVFVESQVSDRCPWATCLFNELVSIGVLCDVWICACT